MPSNIQDNLRAKAEREAAGRASTMPVQKLPLPFTDDDLVTVLYGFGRVSPTSVSLLDGYEVHGGVIRDVPYSIAKHWYQGTRPDGQKPQGRVTVTILPQEATEDDLAAAAGLTPDARRKMAAMVTAGDASHLIEELGPERARQLRDALNHYIAED